MEIKNLTKAAQRIQSAIKNKECIILYGDADLDGASSVLIAQEAIQSIGGQVSAFYFPDKEKEGYGITRKALERLGQYAPAILVAFDLGITNFEEIDIAKKLGFFVIVVDHHEPFAELPKADIIVNPKQPGDEYPFKGFAACGLSFRLAEALVGKSLTPTLRASMEELAALGTIADMMPREQDNVVIIEEGLEALSNSWRPGIRAFLESPESLGIKSLEQQVYQMIAILNARDVKKGLPAAFRLLSCATMPKAKKMVEEFSKLNKIRKEKIADLAEEVRMRIFHKKSESIVFEGGEHFEYMLLGAVASIISQEAGKPTFIFKKNRLVSLGSVRAPFGFNTVKAMTHCAQYFGTYGGHAQASGFQADNANLENLKACLMDYFSSNT